MDKVLQEIQKMQNAIKALEALIIRMTTLVFPTGSGRLSVPKYNGDPASPANGDIWYNTSTHKFRGRANGVSVDLH